MSSLEPIEKWLENPLDYFGGVLLFSKFSKNRTLLKTLQRAETEYNLEKLKYELDKIIDNERQENPKLWKRTNESGTSNEDWSEPHEENAEKNLLFGVSNVSDDGLHNSDRCLVLKEELTKNRNDLYARRNFMHAQLHGVLSNEERYELAKNIITIQPKIDEYNAHLKFIEERNEIPKALEQSSMTALDMRKCLNLKSYVSRYKAKIKHAKSLSEKHKYEALLDKYEKLLK